MRHSDQRRALRAIAACVLLAAGATWLSACGGGSKSTTTTAATSTQAAQTLNTAGVESALKKHLNGLKLGGVPATIYPPGGGAATPTQVGGGRIRISTVSCPGDVPLEKGKTFSCEINARNGGGTVRVTELDAEGKTVRYHARLRTSGAGVTSTTTLTGKLTLG